MLSFLWPGAPSFILPFSAISASFFLWRAASLASILSIWSHYSSISETENAIELLILALKAMSDSLRPDYGSTTRYSLSSCMDCRTLIRRLSISKSVFWASCGAPYKPLYMIFLFLPPTFSEITICLFDFFVAASLVKSFRYWVLYLAFFNLIKFLISFKYNWLESLPQS